MITATMTSLLQYSGSLIDPGKLVGELSVISGGISNIVDSDGNQLVDSNDNELVDYPGYVPIECTISVIV